MNRCAVGGAVLLAEGPPDTYCEEHLSHTVRTTLEIGTNGAGDACPVFLLNVGPGGAPEVAQEPERAMWA